MQVIRENRFKPVFALLSLLLLIGVIVVAVRSGDSSARQHLTIPRPPDAGKRTYGLLLGIPQHGSTLGYNNAPVTLQFFGDLQCVDSRRVMLGALPFLIRHWVRAGKLRIRFRSTETDTSGAGGWYEFREQQTAAMTAGKQGKLWNFIDVFYREQGPEFTGYVDEAFLHRIAVDAGLDLERWEQDWGPVREVGIDLIEADEALATSERLDRTPSFLIGQTGGPPRRLDHFSFEEPKVFDEAIRELL
jgi:protein-disulfide isomerase